MRKWIRMLRVFWCVDNFRIFFSMLIITFDYPIISLVGWLPNNAVPSHCVKSKMKVSQSFKLVDFRVCVFVCVYIYIIKQILSKWSLFWNAINALFHLENKFTTHHSNKGHICHPPFYPPCFGLPSHLLP